MYGIIEEAIFSKAGGKTPTFSIVICLEHDEDIFQGWDQGEGPEYEGQNAKDLFVGVGEPHSAPVECALVNI
jgi:hypothetical protein